MCKEFTNHLVQFWAVEGNEVSVLTTSCSAGVRTEIHFCYCPIVNAGVSWVSKKSFGLTLERGGVASGKCLKDGRRLELLGGWDRCWRQNL